MAAHYRKISLSLLLAALLGVSLFGCGDSEVSTNVDQGRDGNRPRASDQYFLVPAGASQLSGHVTESVDLSVFLYNKTTGEPASDQSIAYEVIESGANQQPTLSAYNGTTIEDGSASVGLQLGPTPGVIKVRATHASSNAVTFSIDVTKLPTGQLEIELVNTGASVMPLRDVDVRLYANGDYSCSEFRPLTQRQTGEVATYVAGSTTETVPFENLRSDQQFLVTAVGRGEAGQIAAGGCREDIVIDAEQITRKELLLQLVPLNPVGRYDVTSHWDFSQALEDSGTVGSTIMRVLNIFQDPGQALYNEFINLLQSLTGLGGSAVDSALQLTGLDDTIINAVNSAVANNDALRRIRDAGQDLRDVVANLEVHSELTIGKMSSNYEFRGTDNWLGITLYWRWNCDANSPPDCGAINIEADANGDFGDLGVLSSQWTGRVVAYNQLQIDSHPLSLRYGRLIGYVLEEVIIPELTNGQANTLSGAFGHWICDGVVSSVADNNGQVCIGDPIDRCLDVQNYCTSAVSTVFGFADMLIDNLEYDVGLRIGGEGLLVETTSDGFVDRIEEGVFEGTMQNADLGQQQASPISATFSAERVDFQTDNL